MDKIKLKPFFFSVCAGLVEIESDGKTDLAMQECIQRADSCFQREWSGESVKEGVNSSQPSFRMPVNKAMMVSLKPSWHKSIHHASVPVTALAGGVCVFRLLVRPSISFW